MGRLNKKESQRAASLERILACAIDLFVRDGYRATTVDAIAAKAGLTKGAVYFYFKTKDSIVLRLLDAAEAIVVAPVLKVIKTSGPKAIDKLVTFIHHQSMLGVSHPQHVLLLILMSIEFCGSKSEIETRVRRIYKRLYNCVEAIIRQGQADGSFRKDASASELAAIVMAAHDGVLVEWYRRAGGLDGKRLTRALRLTLLGGLRAHG